MFLYKMFAFLHNYFVLRALQLLDVFCPVPMSVLGIPQKEESAKPEVCLKGSKTY